MMYTRLPSAVRSNVIGGGPTEPNPSFLFLPFSPIAPFVPPFGCAGRAAGNNTALIKPHPAPPTNTPPPRGGGAPAPENPPKYLPPPGPRHKQADHAPQEQQLYVHHVPLPTHNIRPRCTFLFVSYCTPAASSCQVPYDALE